MKTSLHAWPLPLSLAVVLFFVSCSKDPEPEAPLLTERMIENVTYGQHQRQRMDIYLPQGRDERTPVVVLLHGGFWIEGDKSSFTAIQQHLLAQGVATVNMNYRYIGPNHDYTGLLADVEQALATVKSNASEWGIKSDGFHLAGNSAGGYMALLYGYTAARSYNIKSVVSIAGPVGISVELLADHASNEALLQPVQWLVGAPIPTNENDPNVLRYQQASPITHIQTAVPTLLIHGTADELVPFASIQAMKAALDGAQVSNQLVALPAGKHDFSANQTLVLAALNAMGDWIAEQESQ